MRSLSRAVAADADIASRMLLSLAVGGAFLVLAIGVLIYFCVRRGQTQASLIANLHADSSSKPKRVLAIVNPISGKRRGVQDWSDISVMLRARGFVVDTIVTKYSGHAKELLGAAQQQQQRHNLLVVVGGDGFAYEVLNALGSPPASLAVVPSGTGNGIATSLGIRTPVESAAALLRGATLPLDLMRVSRPSGAQPEPIESVAALSVAWGAIADHDALTERELRRLPGKLLIVPAWIILNARKYRGRVSFTPHKSQGPLPQDKPHTRDAASGRVHIDGEFNLVQVCNLPWIATDVCASPGARADGGCFGILIMRGASRIDLARMFLAAESGAHTAHAAVELYWATEASILPADGPNGLGNIAVDGELLPPSSRASRVDIRCDPAAVGGVVHGL